MNIQDEKFVIEMKTEALKRELRKPEHERNKMIIQRLEKSINRHKHHSWKLNRYKRVRRQGDDWRNNKEFEKALNFI